MVFDRFTARDLQFLGSEYLLCGHLPSDRALVFVENHDRQSNCYVPDKEAPCVSLTVKDGNVYKVVLHLTPHSAKAKGHNGSGGLPTEAKADTCVMCSCDQQCLFVSKATSWTGACMQLRFRKG